MEYKTIWVFGPTAVGKKTLIINGTQPSSFLRELFNLGYENYMPLLVLNTRKEGKISLESNINGRLKFIESVFNSNLSCHFGISGQYIDIPDNLIRLKNKYPDRMKYCLYLHIDIKDFEYRTKKRYPNIKNIKKRYDKMYGRMGSDIKFLENIFNEVCIINI